MMLRHIQIAQVFLRRPPPLFASRSIFTSISRPISVAFPKSKVPPSRARAKRLFTTNNNLEPLKLEWNISPDNYEKLLAHACKSWPPPPSVPPNWSCTWSEWKALLSYFWSSPYYLMLPQVEMHVNLQYGIRGETRPILFSNKRNSFVFTIVDSNEYFLFDGEFSALYHIADVCNDHELVELMAKGDDALVARFEEVEESEEGLSAIQRILARDETVIPLLAEKFLHYTPVPTTPRMERIASSSSPEQDAEFAEYMSRWQSEAELGDDGPNDEQLRELTEKMGRLRSTVNGLLGENQSKEEREEARKLIEEVEGEGEEDVKLMRKKAAKFAKVVEVASEEDIPPEELERVKRETKALKAKIDGVINEMEDFSVEPHQVEVFNNMLATAKSLREHLDELSLTDTHAMAHYLARNLEQNFGAIKNDPKAIDLLIRDDNW